MGDDAGSGLEERHCILPVRAARRYHVRRDGQVDGDGIAWVPGRSGLARGTRNGQLWRRGWRASNVAANGRPTAPGLQHGNGAPPRTYGTGWRAAALAWREWAVLRAAVHTSAFAARLDNR